MPPEWGGSGTPAVARTQISNSPTRPREHVVSWQMPETPSATERPSFWFLRKDIRKTSGSARGRLRFAERPRGVAEHIERSAPSCALLGLGRRGQCDT